MPVAASNSSMRCLRSASGLAEQAAEEVDVLEHRQCGVEILAQPLRHVGDARADAGAVAGILHVAAQHLHRALLDLACAGDQRQPGGLAHAVRADEADHAPGREVERHTVCGRGGAIVVAHVHQARYRGRGVRGCGWGLGRCRPAAHVAAV